MPINLVSGLPGHGKTLRALQVVEQLRKETGRDVYFHHISELRLPWRKLENPTRWMDLPDGSIIVIDEAHEVFPKRPPGSKVPEHVEPLATHRHRGFDFWLITQHAQNQLDHFVRGLIDTHEHTMRLFGAERARIHRWPKLGDPADYHSVKESITEQWKFPTEVYGWYKSAELHTVKRRLPWKPFVTIGGGVAAIGLLGWIGFRTLAGNVEAGAEAVGEASETLTGPNPFRSTKGLAKVDDFVPSLEAAPFTAPFYGSAVQVVQAPVIAGCGMIKVGHHTNCWCNTQQGTRVDMDKRTCMQHVKNGAFRWDRDDDRYPKYEPYVPDLAKPVEYADATGPAPQARAGAAESPESSS